MDDYANMERRLVARLLQYWRTLGGGLGNAAAYSDVDRAEIGAEWDWCFVLDCREDSEDPTLLHVGDGLIADFEDDPTTRQVSKIEPSNLLGKALSQRGSVLRRKLPVVLSGAYGIAHQRTVLYRGIMLPLNGDDGVFGYLLGAATRLVKDSPSHV
jgi:hypothetical protein